MEQLTYNNDRQLDTTNFVRVGDLSNFEGPMLSLFEELSNGHLFLFDWVDRNQSSNRWLIYRVYPIALMNFIKGKISHFELFQERPQKAIFYTDIDSKSSPIFPYTAFEILILPDSYLPNKDNYFIKEDCHSYSRILAVVKNSISRQKQGNEYVENSLC